MISKINIGGTKMAIQDKFNKSNTIYKITKDIDLGGETLTIPEGCTLDFQGGSFSNGTITGNETNIRANYVIFNDITISGTYSISDIYLSWFKIIPDEDCINPLLNCLRLSNGNTISIVHLDKEISIKLTASISYVPVFSNSVITGGIIHQITDNLSSTYAIFETREGNEGIVFDNITIYGDGLTNNNNSDVDIQFGHGIRINGGKNITINNCYITECFGDGINIQVGSAGVDDQFPEDIKINNCTCNYNRRLGIAVEGGKNIIISNTTCRDNGKINRLVYPGSGIDIEPWHEDNYVKNLVISGCDLRDNREWSLADYSWSEGCTDIIISGSVLNSVMIKNQNNHNTTFNGCNFLGYVYVYDSIATFNNCSMVGLLGLLEGNESQNSVNCEINNCKLYFNEEDYSYYNYSPILFRKQNLSPLSNTNNKLVIKNSIIEIGPNIDVTKCYTLFNKSIGKGGDAVIELYNTEITNNKNISITDFVDYFEDCKLTSLYHGIRSREASKPIIFKRCTFITSTDKVIILGGTAKNYTHKVDPYDIQLLQCSFNPDKIYAESKSIDTYFELGYIYDGGKNYKVLIRDPIFPIGTVYSAYNLTMNNYYNIDWLMGDRDFSKTNIDNTSKSKVRYSLSNYLNDYIYRINEDIDLNSDTINIGSGCTLDFSAGGKISNGTINLNNTLVLPLGIRIEDYITASITGNYREGQIVYDSDLKKQKLWNGSAWVNLDGTALAEANAIEEVPASQDTTY